MYCFVPFVICLFVIYVIFHYGFEGRVPDLIVPVHCLPFYVSNQCMHFFLFCLHFGANTLFVRHLVELRENTEVLRCPNRDVFVFDIYFMLNHLLVSNAGL